MSEYYLQPKANAKRLQRQRRSGNCGWLRNSGWHCVLCMLCLPAKMHVNENIWSEICKHAAKMHFVLCKGKSARSAQCYDNACCKVAVHKHIHTHTPHTLTNSYSSMRLSLSLLVFGFVIHLSQVLCG